MFAAIISEYFRQYLCTFEIDVQILWSFALCIVWILVVFSMAVFAAIRSGWCCILKIFQSVILKNVCFFSFVIPRRVSSHTPDKMTLKKVCLVEIRWKSAKDESATRVRQ
jgi:hypothetical protein